MTSRFDELWAAADDGGSAAVGFERPGTACRDDLNLLVGAWCSERAGRIESGLVLEQARRLIVRLLADADVAPRRRRQAGRLIRAIRDIQKGLRG